MPPACEYATAPDDSRRLACVVPPPGAAWPVRAGAVPPLAEPFSVRDSVPGTGAVLVPGAVVALVPGVEQAGRRADGRGRVGRRS
jgi:hypothetical protein